MADTLETIRQIIAKRFDLNPEELTPDRTLDSLGVDSLGVFEVIFEAEETFHIRVDNDQVNIATIGDVVALIDRLVAEQNSAPSAA